MPLTAEAAAPPPGKGGCLPCCAAQPEDPHKDHGMAAPGARKCRDVFCLLLFVVFCECAGGGGHHTRNACAPPWLCAPPRTL